jgi:hypothetical protein
VVVLQVAVAVAQEELLAQLHQVMLVAFMVVVVGKQELVLLVVEGRFVLSGVLAELSHPQILEICNGTLYSHC